LVSIERIRTHGAKLRGPATSFQVGRNRLYREFPCVPVVALENKGSFDFARLRTRYAQDDKQV
jgi:hypothetical protein